MGTRQPTASLLDLPGKIDMPISSFLSFVQNPNSNNQPKQPSYQYFISKALYTGYAQFDCVKFDVVFEVILLLDQWTKVKLLSDNVVLSEYSVTFEGNPNKTDNEALDKGEEESNEACVGVLGDGYNLVAYKAGRYRVDCHFFAQYLTLRRTGVTLDICKAAHTQVMFTVPDNVQLKIEPSIPLETKDPTNTKQKDKAITWTETAESSSSTGGSDEKKPKSLMVTVEQASLCSVGEGILIMSTEYKFTIVHGSVVSFDIEISKEVNILSVDGPNIDNWEVMDYKNASLELIKFDSPVAATPVLVPTTPGNRVLKIKLAYGVESTYSVTVVSEVVMEGTSADVTIPVSRCLGDEISREKGYLAIEARTNVEVAELTRDGLAMLDISEIPSYLANTASNPLLLGYKFLVPSYVLALRVKKHSDVEVLIAACDDAYFVTTVSEEGKVLHKVVLQIRNTQKQYLKID